MQAVSADLKDFIQYLDSHPSRLRLKSKVAVITGAGTGLGQALAIGFLHEGASVVCVSRKKENLDSTLSFSKNLKIPHSADAVAANINSEGDCVRVVRQALNRGTLDILINCAGIHGPIGPFENTSIDDWESAVVTNLVGTARMIKAALSPMKSQQSGSIINVAGGGSLSSRPFFSAYSASKAALVRLTEVLAAEVKPYGIRLNAISPGPLNTRLMEEIIAAGKNAGDNEIRKAREVKSGKGTPFRLPFELCVFLSSGLSNGLSGKVISAVWDDLSYIESNLKQIQGSEIYTMRRVTRQQEQ